MKKEVDGFTFDTYREEDFLCIDSKNIVECLSYAESKGIKAICIDWMRGYWDDDVNFLEGKGFEKVLMSVEEIENIEGINKLTNLSALYIGGDKLPQTINLRSSQYLKELAIEWTNSVIGKDNLPNLEYLSIGGITLPEKNLTDLGMFPNLKELHLTGGNLQDLEGLTAYQNLEIVEIADMRSLKTLKHSTLDLKNLVELTFINCKKLPIQDYKGRIPVSRLGLKEFGNIDTLKWLPEVFPELEYFDFWATKVLDGDLTPLSSLKHLKEVRFKDEKHYQISCKALNDGIKNQESLNVVIGESIGTATSSENQLPTETWTEQGIDQMLVEKVQSVLSAFVHSIDNTNGEKSKIDYFKIAIKALDQLQLENDHFLDTACRQDLVDFFNERANQEGIDEYEDITWKWRQEW
ncbi:hypothetical protein FNH22_11370 [Fulvivirga sp. M361]|uniref:hypothetical protein n=1 Tax=Fulvivirga sp. M361 TaxID=2594266 RepID=UPI00117B06D1|nr:hypothetical protein [Fulvivirga sp. M361]TRX59116.1 hypothetical protein FNH22_11370 [Fulvivirga sp. M361]